MLLFTSHCCVLLLMKLLYVLSADTYTLICIDPDVSKSHSPIIHWMVTNIPDGNIQNGQTVLPYIGPMPPPGKNHTYYFLLYKQSLPVNGSTVDGYAGPHCQGR